MIVYDNSNEVPYNKKRSISVGKFDGLHLGHQQLIKKMLKTPDTANTVNTGAESLFIIINNSSSKTTPNLTTRYERINLLERFGISGVLFLDIEEEVFTVWGNASVVIKNFSPEEFIKFLQSTIGFAKYFAGENHTFGRKKAGTINTLKSISAQLKSTSLQNFDLSFETTIVSPEIYNDKIVSTSLIKTLIKKENIEIINQYLGYNYFFIGEVVKGRQIGATLGFPTANITVSSNKIIPKKGVYLSEVRIKGCSFYGVTNIGTRPTIENNNTANKVFIESHILNFNEIIYGRTIELHLLKYIRDEIRFDSLSQLKTQITEDIAYCSSLIE